MWDLILKADIDFVFNKNEITNLGMYNPEENKIYINLPAIKAFVMKTPHEKLPKRKFVNDQMYMRTILRTIEHEAIHAALNDSIEDIIEEESKRMHSELVEEGKDVDYDEIKLFTKTSLYMLLQEYAVRFMQGMRINNIVMELSQYVSNIQTRATRDLFLALMSGDEEDALFLNNLMETQKEFLMRSIHYIQDRTTHELKVSLEQAGIEYDME